MTVIFLFAYSRMKRVTWGLTMNSLNFQKAPFAPRGPIDRRLRLSRSAAWKPARSARRGFWWVKFSLLENGNLDETRGPDAVSLVLAPAARRAAARAASSSGFWTVALGDFVETGAGVEVQAAVITIRARAAPILGFMDAT